MGGGNTKMKYAAERGVTDDSDHGTREDQALNSSELPPGCYAVTFTSKALGMELAQRKKGGVVVKHAVEGYQAYSEGIRRGMRVLSVDGQDISFESLENCMAKLRTAPRPVTIIFKDGIFFERKRLSYSNTDENEETTANESFAELQSDEHALYASKGHFEEFSGPACFFCQAVATCKICVGENFQTVCDDCSSWRLRERQFSPAMKQKSIQPSRSTFLDRRINEANSQHSTLDFFVDGKHQSGTEISRSDANADRLELQSTHHTQLENSIDDATKAMILAIQEQDQKEEEEMKQRQRQTDEASLAAIQAIQRQDEIEAQERARSRQLQEEQRRQNAIEAQERARAKQIQEEQRRQNAEAELSRIKMQEEQMLLAAIEASQLEAQMKEEQFREIMEPLSWKVPQDAHASSQPALGERHCRQRGCSCMQFEEDASRPTVCICGHGEMYHRLDTEAPLAKLNIPGASKCIYCSKAIVSGNGFSGWYNEVQDSDGALCHVECWEQYKDSVSAKCVKCLQPLRKKEGVFSGRYKKLGDGRKCHKECFAQYKIDIGEYCDICNEALLREYVILQDGSGDLQAPREFRDKVYAHKDCWHKHLRGGMRQHSNYQRTILRAIS
eukprot:g278.t1